MRKLLLFAICFINIHAIAQSLMRVTMKDGMSLDFSINNINESAFSESKQIYILGDWLNIIEGSIVRYSFYSDGTCKTYDYYSAISYDYTIHPIKEEKGTYSIKNSIITIKQENGATLLIEVVSLNGSQMVSGVGEVFYKVQEPAYKMTTADNPIMIGNDGDIIKYADTYYSTIENNRIKAITDGIGYVVVQDGQTEELKAYKVEIDYVTPSFVEWPQYFNTSLNGIIESFGSPDFRNDNLHRLGYLYFNAAIQSVVFTFTDNWESVKRISVHFYSQEKGQPYYDFIRNNYTLFSSSNAVQMFYDPYNPDFIIYVNTTEGIYDIDFYNQYK